MRIIERSTIAVASRELNEDRIVTTDEYAAVINGHTDPWDTRRTNGKPYGYIATEVIEACLQRLGVPDSADAIIDAITDDLVEAAEVLADTGHTPPSPMASIVVYSKTLHQVIRVGKGAVAIGHTVYHSPMSAFDELVIGARRFALTHAPTIGEHPARTQRNIEAVCQQLAPYRDQGFNTQGFGYYGTAVLDGSTVPMAQIETFDVPEGTDTVCLMSDGYPIADTSLEAVEQHLANILVEDPLLVGWYVQTRHRVPGDTSYDHRSFLKLDPTR